MKLKLMWGALMTIAFASCTQEDVLNNGVGQNMLRASMEEIGAKSRVGFTDAAQAEFFWTKGDRIGVTTASSQTFQGMTLVGEGGQATGTFSGTMSAAASGYAVYPYGAQGRHLVSSDVLTYNLPATYEYATLDTEYAKSDGNSHNAPMWGNISNGSVAFKHLGGVIAFSVSELPESTDNLEFVLTATNQISGSFSATLTENEPKIVAATTNVADADKKVTITFSTAAGQTSGYFYVPVPTGSLGNLSLVILDGQTEVATGAWDNITIARKDIRRATIGNQSIIGGNGEIKQVTSVSDVNGALNTTEDNLTVRVSGGVPTGDNTIEIPATLETATTTFSFASVADGAKITIKDEDGGSYDGKIIIEIPEDETLPEVVANIPYGEVYIKQGTVTTLVTSAADNTTIIGAKATVGTLTVAKGNVRIEDGGQVTKIERASGNSATVYVVYEGATAPTIQMGEGIVLMSASEWESATIVTNAEELSTALSNSDISTIVLDENLTLSDILVINRAITLNGNGKTLTSTAGRAINVSGADGVTIKNLIIEASGERAINVIQNATNVTIDNVTATAANYTVNVASSAPNAIVTIKNSTLTGLNVVNVGAENANVTIDKAHMVCNDQNESEDYAALMLNKDAANAKITATNVTFDIKDDSGQAHNAADGGSISINGQEVVANAVAIITYPGPYYYSFLTLEAAIEKAKEGETITLIRNIEISELIKVEKAIIIDLNQKTVTANCRKAFEIYADATIKNGTIWSQARCVDTRKPVELTLTNVKLEAPKYYTENQQPLTIGGSESDTKVTMSDVTIDAGSQGYCIISFVKTELTATDSNLSGYVALYVKEGSENSTFEFVKSTLSGTTGDNDVEGNSFATIAIEANGVTVTMDNDCELNSTGTYHKTTFIKEGVTGSNITGPTAE